jgi:hypothetical protein
MIARVTTPPLEWVELTVGGLARRRVWRTFAPLRVGLEGPFGPTFWTIPAGTYTDGASVPWPVSLILLPDSVNPAATLVHDALYRQAGRIWVDHALDGGGLRLHDVPRRAADDLFRDLLIDTGTPRSQAHAMWAAVRAFGRYPGTKATMERQP